MFSFLRQRPAPPSVTHVEIDGMPALFFAAAAWITLTLAASDKPDPARIAQHAGLVHALLGATGGVRSPGAPALIMAHIAAGHYTAYVERAMPASLASSSTLTAVKLCPPASSRPIAAMIASSTAVRVSGPFDLRRRVMEVMGRGWLRAKDARRRT